MARLSGEQYSMLREYQLTWDRLALRLLRAEYLPRPTTLGVTSSIPGEGKTTASIGLAVALAQEAPGEVALVEANFHHPTLARDFGVPANPGLTDYLMGRCPLLAVSKTTGIEQLRLFPAGDPSQTNRDRGTPSLGLNGRLRHQIQEVVETLEARFSCVVLDLPPVLGNVDTEEMLRYVHGVILVARTGVTPLDKLRQATLHLESGKLLGVVQLGDERHIPRWMSWLFSE